ncbi:MAG: tetratricopeptide repeat protein [Aridibacter famidurans]|nr:tetratricopeptide repeat protein [Aridibacter famidurans]
MKKFYPAAILPSLLILFVSAVPAQDPEETPPPPPPGIARELTSEEAKLSELLAKRLEELPQEFEITREEREEAYAKLLEGQRYLWSMRRMRSTNPGVSVGARMAKNALQKAVELNPKLAEGYTALAELVLSAPPQDLEEAISLSEIAVKLDPDNFGGYRFLGRLYTIKSNLGRGAVNAEAAASAISAWKEIARLDSRNAEAWAFLAAFYRYTDQKEERIQALRNWLSSAAPVDQGFYGRVMREEGELSPEVASAKLGEALLESGRYEEALEILTRAISEDPGNLELADMLGEALENVSAAQMSPVVEALRQAVFANPDSLSLNRLLARTLARSGNLEDGAKVLETASAKASATDGNASAEYLVALGDLLADSERTERAVEAYERALKARKIGSALVRDADNREFAKLVIARKLDALRRAELYDRALSVINNSRTMFGEADISLDKELVTLYREKGDREGALAFLRSARERAPRDYSLIRTEASILTDLGRVEEAVGLIRKLIDSKPSDAPPSMMYDDFVNYLFISSLYTQADEGRKAILAATNAFSVAEGQEQRQIAKLTLASAQKSSGDPQSAEKNLREVLAENPDNPIALNNLGYLFLETGKNFEEALELIKRAVKTDPKNPSYLDSLGWAHFKLGHLEQAELSLRKALKYDPVSSTILDHLGDVLKARGKTAEAREVWEKALKFTGAGADAARIREKIAR